jgi:hypothetical protein
MLFAIADIRADVREILLVLTGEEEDGEAPQDDA